MAAFGIPGGAELIIIAIVVMLVTCPALLVGLVVWSAVGSKAKDIRPLAPPAWLADPAGRHEVRYWDGAAWTAHVSDAGVQSEDLL